LPCEGQADKWSASARERYQFILRQADSLDYVSREYYDGCMIDRNHRLVDSAGLLLAVYNGVRRSGTGATVNYARKMGREIIVIDPITLSVSHEGGGVSLRNGTYGFRGQPGTPSLSLLNKACTISETPENSV